MKAKGLRERLSELRTPTTPYIYFKNMSKMNFCLWITGMPGSGKTSIADRTEKLLRKIGYDVLTLNLDRLRKILTPQPRYTDEEREVVYRALVLVAKLLVENGLKHIIIDATGNRRRFRQLARALIPEFAEIYVKCPLEVCKSRESSRDTGIVEGNLYQKAAKGQLGGNLPGVTVPYEAPEDPEAYLPSNELTPDECAEELVTYVQSRWA
jgi:adenylylsulfate kinase